MPNISNDPEEAQIGKDLGSRDFLADDGLLNDYFEGLEIDADWYSGNPYQAQVAPSMTVTAVDGGFSAAASRTILETSGCASSGNLTRP